MLRLSYGSRLAFGSRVLLLGFVNDYGLKGVVC